MTRQSLGTLTAAVLLAGLAVIAVGRASAVSTENRVRAEMRDSVAFVAASAIKPLRDSMIVLEARRFAAERNLAKLRQDARSAFGNAGRASDSSRVVLADSAATVVQLRGALFVQVATTERLSAEFRAYLAADSVVHQRTATSDSVTHIVLAQSDAALVAMTQARDAWRGAATCKVWFIKCPTRTQAYLLGAVTGMVAVVVLR